MVWKWFCFPKNFVRSGGIIIKHRNCKESENLEKKTHKKKVVEPSLKIGRCWTAFEWGKLSYQEIVMKIVTGKSHQIFAMTSSSWGKFDFKNSCFVKNGPLEGCQGSLPSSIVFVLGYGIKLNKMQYFNKFQLI